MSSISMRGARAIDDRSVDLFSARPQPLDGAMTLASAATYVATAAAPQAAAPGVPGWAADIKAWDPNKTYWGPDGAGNPHPGVSDEVEWQGAFWVAKWNNVDQNPVALMSAPNTWDSPWQLDTSHNTANYTNAVSYALVAPEAPTNVSAGYISSSAVALFWDTARVMGVGDVTSYDVYDNGVKVGVTSDTSFTVKGLAAGSNHVFTVDANDAWGTSTLGQTAAPIATHTTEIMSGKYFSPYVDMTLPSTNILQMSHDSGLRDFTLSFMQSVGLHYDSGKLDVGVTPSLGWGGITNTTVPTGGIIDQVHAVEGEGGTVTIAFGGYTGIESAYIAEEYAKNLQTQAGGHYSAKDAMAKAQSVLVSEYQSVISTYGVTHLDFDIEDEYWGKKNADGTPVLDENGHQVMVQYLNSKGQNALQDTLANGMRDDAIKTLQAGNPDLHVSFTVATSPTDISADAKTLLLDAVHDGVKIDTVNLMVMDYGQGQGTDMLANAESAATAFEKWLVDNHLDSIKVGITPMIGQNDVAEEVFTLQNARDLEAWAATKPWVAGMGQWSLSRDQYAAHDATTTDVSGDSSGVAQDRFEFAGILNGITIQANDDANIILGDDSANTFKGLGGNDTIDSGLGADTLDGGAGNDSLIGGRGADRLTGGSNPAGTGSDKDRFVYTKITDSVVGASDYITDLTNKDKIVLSALDADTTTAGNQKFHLAGDHFTNHAGELIATYDAGTKTTTFAADVNGDGVADLSIQAHGNHTDFTGFIL